VKINRRNVAGASVFTRPSTRDFIADLHASAGEWFFRRVRIGLEASRYCFPGGKLDDTSLSGA
jgi:hypothetical protein